MLENEREKVIRAFQAEKVIRPPETPEVLASREWLLSGEQPVDLEIGCGVGWHPIGYANAHPNRRLIAIEQTKEKFEKFRGRIVANQNRGSRFDNLIAIHADAVAWITSYVPESSLDRILILYPNPNPKNAAARWIRMPFFAKLLSRLKPGGEIRFRTNREEYAREIREFGAMAWGLSASVDREFTSVDVAPAQAATHFEKKYLEAGESCYEIVFSNYSIQCPTTTDW